MLKTIEKATKIAEKNYRKDYHFNDKVFMCLEKVEVWYDDVKPFCTFTIRYGTEEKQHTANIMATYKNAKLLAAYIAGVIEATE